MPLGDSHLGVPQRLKRSKRPMGFTGKEVVELLPSRKGLTPLPTREEVRDQRGPAHRVIAPSECLLVSSALSCL